MDARQTGKQYYPASRLSFKSYDLKIDLSGFKMSRTNEDYFKDNYQMLNIAQLNYYQDSVGKIIHDKRKEAMDFSRPYFNYFKDTAFYRKANYSHAKNLTHGLVRSEKREMVERAINTARTLKDDIYHNQAQEIENYNKLLWRYQIEWHRKFALSLACLTLFFIGAPLGAIIRKGGIGTPTVVSIAMFIIFYILTIVGEKSAKEGVVMPVTGMWLPTLVLMPIGFYLTHKANIDAFSFSFDRFRAFIRRTRKSISKLRNARTAAV